MYKQIITNFKLNWNHTGLKTTQTNFHYLLAFLCVINFKPWKTTQIKTNLEQIGPI